jgi:hypothetical protein
MSRFRVWMLLAAVLVAARPAVPAADEPSLPDVLARAAVYVDQSSARSVQYHEQKHDTLIKTMGTRDLPARGRFWIEPATGRVLMSELMLENRRIKVAIDVSYQSEPLLGLLVPIEMRERYEGARLHSLIECRAIYGKFRQVNRVNK